MSDKPASFITCVFSHIEYVCDPSLAETRSSPPGNEIREDRSMDKNSPGGASHPVQGSPFSWLASLSNLYLVGHTYAHVLGAGWK